MIDKNCLSYWFPKLQAANIRVPKTMFVTVTNANKDLMSLLDGKETDALETVVTWAREAIEMIGGPPAFLRTGQSSGKHNWRDCCYVTDVELLPTHITNLVEWSHLVDFLGLAHDVWVVREMLPVTPIATLPGYNWFPLVKEVRAFIADGQITCSHDYWPRGAILEGLPRHAMTKHDEEAEADRLHALASATPDEREAAHAVARQVARAFQGDGAWSVDLLLTTKGWYVTDMAEAERSYHDPECPHCPEAQKLP